MTCAYLAYWAIALAIWRGWLDGMKPRRTKPQLRLIIGGKAA